MRKSRSTIFVRQFFVLLFGLMVFTGCGGDDPLSVNEEAFLLLEGTWGLGTIELDGIDQSTNYPGFTLTFDTNGYSASSGGSLIGSGTWLWSNELGRDISLIEGKEIRIVTLTATSLVFTFTLNQPGGGTANGINGDYRVSLVK